MSSTYAYCRVSTAEQNLDRQLIAMQKINVPMGHIFTDKVSGKDFERPAYRLLITTLRSGDLLYIKSIDRLGRGYAGILEQWRVITKEIGADIIVLDMPLLDTRRDRNLIGTLIADIVLQLLSFVSETERNAIKERQREGIIAAKARGVRFGRPPKPLPDGFARVVDEWKNGKVSLTELREKCGNISESTFYRRLRENRENSGK
jgi:DNA invertase Pin-like site-specific DNA recombinase